MDYPRYISKKGHPFPLLSAALDVFRKVGIRIDLYYVFVEELRSPPQQKVESGFDGYEIVSLGPQDMKAISSSTIFDRKESEEYLLNRLKRGPKCFGVRFQDEIIAFSWFDLKQGNFSGRIFSLREDEACLFDAYTLPSHRGKGLAPHVRSLVYKELSKVGREKLLSASDFFNIPAIRFKKKLHAKLLELRLSIKFRGFHLDFRLRPKRYEKEFARFKTLYLSVRAKGLQIIEF